MSDDRQDNTASHETDPDEDKTMTASDIEALVDGEFSDSKARHVLEKIERVPHLKNLYRELQEQKALLKQWWAEYKKDH